MSNLSNHCHAKSPNGHPKQVKKRGPRSVFFAIFVSVPLMAACNPTPHGSTWFEETPLNANKEVVIKRTVLYERQGRLFDLITARNGDYYTLESESYQLPPMKEGGESPLYQTPLRDDFIPKRFDYDMTRGQWFVIEYVIGCVPFQRLGIKPVKYKYTISYYESGRWSSRSAISKEHVGLPVNVHPYHPERLPKSGSTVPFSTQWRRSSDDGPGNQAPQIWFDPVEVEYCNR
jgi:hypothetical protein